MKEMMQLQWKPIEEVENVRIGDVVVDKVGSKDVESA
jgi:hypothetical protein